MLNPGDYLERTRMQIRMALVGVLLCSVSLLGVAEARGENWPQWRGPDGTSVSSEKDLPLKWNQDRRHCVEDGTAAVGE